MVLFQIINHPQNHYKWTTIIIPNYICIYCNIYIHILIFVVGLPTWIVKGIFLGHEDMSKAPQFPGSMGSLAPFFVGISAPGVVVSGLKSGAWRPAPLVSTWRDRSPPVYGFGEPLGFHFYSWLCLEIGYTSKKTNEYEKCWSALMNQRMEWGTMGYPIAFSKPISQVGANNLSPLQQMLLLSFGTSFR